MQQFLIAIDSGLRAQLLIGKHNADGTITMHVQFKNYDIIRGSIVVSISACHAEDPGSIPGRGVIHSSGEF